ncbi:ATP-binding protein [Flavobacterium sp. W21_SRS_FM6]|uniref:sensor histidine kinase n=1 Tax=Flavobacterium sp. W21_SRS_FM6 TaxID=3240268 RepID=UPI003F90C357
MRISIRNKTILGIAAIEAVLLIIIVITVVHFMHTTANDNLVKRAITTATLFATLSKNAVLSYDIASIYDFVDEVLENPDIKYARVLGVKGVLFAEDGDNQHLGRPFKEDTQVSDVDDDIFDTYAEISVNGEIYGRVEIGISVNSIQRSIDKVTQLTTSLAIVEIILVALFSYILGSYLTRQLNKLRQSATAISKSAVDGKFKLIEVNPSTKDEINDVNKAFNQLILTLQTEYLKREHYQRELVDLNAQLETKIKRRTERLSEKNEQLEESNKLLKSAQQQLLHAEKMASIGQLAAGVAHEINNPIGFVISNINTLEEYVTSYITLSQYVLSWLGQNPNVDAHIASTLTSLIQDNDFEFINSDVLNLLSESSEGLQRVNDIVKGLSQFARIDSETKQLFDINKCIRTSLRMLNNELKYHCEVELALTELPLMQMNVGKITQVLTNLLVNASHAIEDKGTIRVSSQILDNTVIVTVCDTGKGIKTEHLSSIFNPFFTTKPEDKGTGLGLSISYDIAKEHGGMIAVESTEGEGSCFSLHLPLSSMD